jgi:hypothetical protein
VAVYSEHRFISAAFRPDIVHKAMSVLQRHGYVPLLSRAREAYYSALCPPVLPDPKTARNVSEPLGTPLVGDLFYPRSAEGLFYIGLFDEQVTGSPRLRVGALGRTGDAELVADYRRFVRLVRNSYPSRGRRKWSSYGLVNTQFGRLTDAKNTKCVLASSISNGEFEAAQILQDHQLRSCALRIKAAGGILESDLQKQLSTSSEVLEETLGKLEIKSLIDRKDIVICRRTEKQVAVSESQEHLAELMSSGLCGECGTPIAEERTERLASTSMVLRRLLNGSLWMSASLAKSFIGERVPANRIALNVQHGTEEIDAFVDVDGSLIMIELKDKEFSMGHAYSFGARLAKYKPRYGIIVATKGVAPEVKSHFDEIKVGAKITYVDRLEDLQPGVAAIIDSIKSIDAYKLIDKFQRLATVVMPLADSLGLKIGLESSAMRVAHSEQLEWRRPYQ